MSRTDPTTGAMGGCACGAIRFQISAPAGLGVCHCRACQYASGGGAAYVALAPKGSLQVTAGSAKIHFTAADSGARIGRAFCADCGTPLYSLVPPTTPFDIVNAGALDDRSSLQPVLEVYTQSAPPWHAFHPDVPAYPGSPTPI